MRRADWPALALCTLAISGCKVERRAGAGRADEIMRGAPSLSLPTEPRALAATLGVPADSLRVAGQERYDRQAYDSAATILSVEVARARTARDEPAEARARMWLGLAQWHLGDLKPARENGEASVSIKRKLGLDTELSRSFNALGLLAWHEGRYSDALTLFDSAIVTAKRNRDPAGVARAISNVPLVQVELGQFDSARVQFNLALRAGRETEDDRVQGNALANLAMLEIRLGNAAKALPLLADARQHYGKIGYGTGQANALGQLSTAWSQLGDLQLAVASADSGLAIARAEGLQQEVAATLEVLADLYAQAGDLKRSLQTLNTADSLDAAIGLALEQGTNERRTAAILGEINEASAAVVHARKALAIHQKEKARGEETYDRIQLAYSLALAGDSAQARIQADSALKTAIAVKNPAAIRDAAGVSAHLALLAGNARSALSYLDLARGAQSSVDWRLADLRGQSLHKLGRLAEAKIEEEKSLSALERERASLGFGPLRAGYLASRSAPFSHLIEINLARGDTAAAFRVAASLPGRALSEHLGESGPNPGALSTDANRETELHRIAALEEDLDQAVADNGAPEKRRSLEKALQSARSDFEDDLNRAAERPSAHSAGGQTTLVDAQRSLASGDALLLLISGPEQLDVFAVTATRVSHRKIALSERKVRSRVRFAREFTGTRSAAGEVPTPLGDLFDSLIKPIVSTGAFTGVKRIKVVAQGSLASLPFAALWNRATGKFLIEDFIISYLPTVGMMNAARTPAQVRAPAVFVPLPDSLPGTTAEARAIASMYPASQTFIGRDASEGRFRSALRAGRAVHVASHGSHNPQNPLFSRMVVGARKSSASSDDGRIEVHEILDLKTTSPLVFLSGCETGIGSNAEGPFEGSDEGSLAYAFLTAGAQTVVATLWRVNDAVAARIAEAFYKQLKAGAPPDEALAVAQRTVLAEHRSYTWAAYTVSGM